MSDSEDDFMSDKFLVEVTQPKKSYSEQRHSAALKSLRKSQADNKPSHKQLELERRHAGLNTSLFDAPSASQGASGSDDSAKKPSGGNKAMEMMKKMGWSVGEGLGRKRSASPSESSKRARVDEDGEDQPRGGIGAASGSRSRPVANGGGRTEPIRISMWAGRKGISAREASPPPIPTTSSRNVDYLDPKRMARLGAATDDFRVRQQRGYADKQIEGRAEKAREMLIDFDREAGVKFHPLHVSPMDALGTLPKPLLRLIYPSQARSPSPPSPSPPSPSGPSRSPTPERKMGSYVSNAEKLRDQMRREMLSSLGDYGESVDAVRSRQTDRDLPERKAEEVDYSGIDWEAEVSSTKRVLAMQPEKYLEYLLSQLRHEHLFCFWCAYKYGSYEEMEGSGGCPGEDEDDH